MAQAEAVTKLLGHAWTAPLVPFFERAADTLDSAYVLNLLVVPHASESASDYAVGWHRDATLGAF